MLSYRLFLYGYNLITDIVISYLGRTVLPPLSQDVFLV